MFFFRNFHILLINFDVCGVSPESSQSGLLRKQLNDARDECVTLKSAVHRLNTELSRYQAKFRPLKPSEVQPRLAALC